METSCTGERHDTMWAGNRQSIDAGLVHLRSYVCCLDGGGGDFVQFCKASDRQFGLTVADVAGHGRDAAPSRDVVLDVLGNLDEAKRNERHWLINLNGQLCQALGDDRFCAAVSARFEWSENDAATVTSVAVAGMPTPVLYRAATGSVERIGSGALPLGTLDEPRFLPDPVRGSAEPGDLLVIFTDGVSEAHRQPRALLGVHRVEQLVEVLAGGGAEAVLKGLIASVRSFVGAAGIRDDVSIAVIEFKGTGLTHHGIAA